MSRNRKRYVTLYRAADDGATWQGAHFSEDEDDARAYLDDPGFGGERLFEYEVSIDESTVVEATGRHAREVLAEAARYDDPDEQARAWNDDSLSFVFQVLENRAAVERRLRDAGFLWVVYEDDYPEGAITWKWIGPTSEAPQASAELQAS